MRWIALFEVEWGKGRIAFGWDAWKLLWRLGCTVGGSQLEPGFIAVAFPLLVALASIAGPTRRQHLGCWVRYLFENILKKYGLIGILSSLLLRCTLL